MAEVKIDQRESSLRKALADVGLTLRSDSVMCQEYLSGKGIFSISDICHEMAVMHYLYEYTTYKKDLQRIVQYVVKTWGTYKGMWRNAAHSVKVFHMSFENVPDGKTKKWPWLQKQTETEESS